MYESSATPSAKLRFLRSSWEDWMPVILLWMVCFMVQLKQTVYCAIIYHSSYWSICLFIVDEIDVYRCAPLNGLFIDDPKWQQLRHCTVLPWNQFGFYHRSPSTLAGFDHDLSVVVAVLELSFLRNNSNEPVLPVCRYISIFLPYSLCFLSWCSLVVEV